MSRRGRLRANALARPLAAASRRARRRIDRGHRRRDTLAALLAVTSAVLAVATPAIAVTPRTNLPAIESQVMCVTCKIPLMIAESPQADRERAYIRALIAKGQNENQIKQALVGQYGRQVLALPAAHGFDLAAYLVPIAVLAFVLGLLALLLPRWRRRGGDDADGGSPSVESQDSLSPADAARLDADLARFD